MVDERIVFGKDDITMPLIIRDLGVRKMIAPHLYWGLSLVWDGKEYERDPKYKGSWNGPWEIIPRTAWRTGVSMYAYRVPPDVLTPGRHVLRVRDEFSESNAVTIFVGTAKESPGQVEEERVDRKAIPRLLGHSAIAFQVQDELGNPVPQASIVVGDPRVASGAFVTDERGMVVASCAPDEKRITVSADGYEPLRLDADKLSSAKLNVVTVRKKATR